MSSALPAWAPWPPLESAALPPSPLPPAPAPPQLAPLRQSAGISTLPEQASKLRAEPKLASAISEHRKRGTRQSIIEQPS